jgi:hypothetical protein
LLTGQHGGAEPFNNMGGCPVIVSAKLVCYAYQS